MNRIVRQVNEYNIALIESAMANTISELKSMVNNSGTAPSMGVPEDRDISVDYLDDHGHILQFA